jgi:hypothetical protein
VTVFPESDGEVRVRATAVSIAKLSDFPQTVVFKAFTPPATPGERRGYSTTRSDNSLNSQNLSVPGE